MAPKKEAPSAEVQAFIDRFVRLGLSADKAATVAKSKTAPALESLCAACGLDEALPTKQALLLVPVAASALPLPVSAQRRLVHDIRADKLKSSDQVSGQALISYVVIGSRLKCLLEAIKYLSAHDTIDEAEYKLTTGIGQ